MFFSVYVSTATRLMSEEELNALLEQSRAKNARADITGLLLYKDGNFMQFLEGAKEKVCALLEEIRMDPRHHGMIILLQEERPAREFPEWSMGFQTLSGEKMPDAHGYNEFFDLPLTSEEFLLHPSRCLQLLFSIRASIP
jgi:hypothetical protein